MTKPLPAWLKQQRTREDITAPEVLFVVPADDGGDCTCGQPVELHVRVSYHRRYSRGRGTRRFARTYRRCLPCGAFLCDNFDGEQAKPWMAQRDQRLRERGA